jgi:E3 SUMO-protein ligase RanBP2
LKENTPTKAAQTEKPKEGHLFGASIGKPQDTTGFLALGAKDFQGFGDLAKNAGTNGGFLFGSKPGENKTSLFGTNTVPQLFGGSKPAVLFGSQIPKPTETAEDGDGEDGNANPEEYEPQVDFRPLVVLQEVEVKTGEEDEEVLFKERCKLFRYSSDTKEWKEKGVGEIKILRHKETSAHRVLMRRDQVLKLCANHRILPEIKLELANEKQVRWSTNDYSENEAKHEILLAKFRHEDEAQRFKAEFEKAQTQYSSSTSPSKPHASATVKKSESKPCIGAGSLAELIKTEKGSWSCTQCLVSLYFVF